MTWYRGLEASCRPEAPLSDLTWYRLGGAARWLFTPSDEDELVELLARCRMADVSWRVLGRGANVLVRDEGVDAAVIMLSGAAWQEVTWTPPRVRAGAGTDFTQLVKEACARGLAGLEGLAGIPGTVGGIVRMNAGGKYGMVADRIEKLRLLQADGTIAEVAGRDVAFSYRHTDLRGAIVLDATFVLAPGSSDDLLAEHRRVWLEKSADQPPLGARSAGCIFKNPPGNSAGMLLDQAGMKGQRRGNAEISKRHANFILAHAGATARDVLELVALAKDRVREAHGIELELEVEVW